MTNCIVCGKSVKEGKTVCGSQKDKTSCAYKRLREVNSTDYKKRKEKNKLIQPYMGEKWAECSEEDEIELEMQARIHNEKFTRDRTDWVVDNVGITLATHFKSQPNKIHKD
jgi:hypothetical protein